jgi:hypothetical protein
LPEPQGHGALGLGLLAMIETSKKTKLVMHVTVATSVPAVDGQNLPYLIAIFSVLPSTEVGTLQSVLVIISLCRQKAATNARKQKARVAVA